MCEFVIYLGNPWLIALRESDDVLDTVSVCVLIHNVFVAPPNDRLAEGRISKFA